MGFTIQYRKIHPDVFPEGTKTATIVQHCVYKTFTRAEIDSMLANQPGAYRVKEVPCMKAEKQAGSATTGNEGKKRKKV